MSIAESDVSDVEFDFEAEEREMGSQGETTQTVVKRVLEAHLAEQIAKIIEQQAAQAVERAVTRTALGSSGVVLPVGGGGSATISGAVRTGAQGDTKRVKGDLKAASVMLEEFDPEDRDLNIDSWLAMIDHLGEVHGWSEYEKSCFMQMKLKGSARAWAWTFNRRDDFELSWSEWKVNLKKAFPRQHDFAVSLEELVERRKLAEEPMTRYYHAKLVLCGRVGIGGEKAVSCIIRGLPEELRANAYAYRCNTPEALYSQFLAGLENYRSPRATGTGRKGESYSAMAKTRRPNPSPAPIEAKRQSTEGPRRLRCYNCQEYATHMSKDCPKPRQDRCRYCGKEGHFIGRCPERRQAAWRTGGKRRKEKSSDEDEI